jgi:hypothetical protein
MVTLIVLNIILIIILVFLLVYIFCGKKDYSKNVDNVDDDEEEIIIDNKSKPKREPKYGRVFEGRVVTDEEYQQIIKYKRNDFSSLLEDVEREYEHLKELNK